LVVRAAERSIMSRSAAAALHFLFFTIVCVVLIGKPAAAATDDTADATQPAAAEKRPALLLPLYVSFGALQVLDAHSTLRATTHGAREANPMIGALLDKPNAFVAAKIGVAVSTVIVTERLWKQNRTAAVLTMIALNGAYAAIVAHNYAIEAHAAR